LSDIGAAAGIRGNEGQVLGYKNNVLQAVTLNGPPFIPAPFGSVNSGDLGPAGAMTRAEGAVYQNTTGKPLLLLVYVDTGVTANTGTDIGAANLLIDSINPPLKEYGTTYSFNPSGGALISVEIGGLLVNFVPPGFYYQVKDESVATGFSDILLWFEIQ